MAQFRVYWLDEDTEQQGKGPICMSREAAIRWAGTQEHDHGRYELSEIQVPWLVEVDRILGRYGSRLEWIELEPGIIRARLGRL